ncbi:uncharacterized protein LOC129587976 isoform X2 [Paramacrobiotus metropolitanus]|uniref:uncharacterized protein LOC129587976 isoform X2 n=1 Tax=Paramacrobiotus metropolitanus TaxID=2943436 RepID=UPI002445DC59|nr:uncharacterized protein LOC129587976 isoform X2 [Paramacrobiotus metropolitanus]
MEGAPLVMPQFQRLLATANQINYQNTVVVHNDDDSWWLGYIQNIQGDHAFIHFDAKKAAPRWLHMGRVWALPFYWNIHLIAPNPPEMPVYAALRDENDGPFRFRPVTRLGILYGCDKCQMFYVKTDTAGTNDQQNRALWQLVQNCQITEQLPPADSPLLHQSGGSLRCSRYMVPFPATQTLFRDASDKVRIVKHFVDTCKGNKDYVWNGGRFCLRTERDGCTFVVLSREMDAEMSQNMVATLTQVLETHLANRALLPAISMRNQCMFERCLEETATRGPSSTFMPPQEQAFIRKITAESHELPIDKIHITVPRMLLRCDESEMHMASRVMYGLNKNFPSVPADMLAKVTVVYARWMRTLSYPEDWQPIRNFLLVR